MTEIVRKHLTYRWRRFVTLAKDTIDAERPICWTDMAQIFTSILMNTYLCFAL